MTLLVPPSSVLRPELRRPLEHFVQAAFGVLAMDVSSGQEVSFALGGGGGAAGPRLYDYRPLYRAYIEERADRLLELADGRAALVALERDPGVVAYAETHAPAPKRPAEALRRAVLVPLLVGVAERCDGFDFDVEAFEAVYGAVERGVTAKETRVSAFTPLAGVLLSNPPADLGSGVTLRRASLGEIGARWPESSGLVPEGFGREPEELLYLELDIRVEKGARHSDAAALAGHAVTALRLATGASVRRAPPVRGGRRRPSQRSRAPAAGCGDPLGRARAARRELDRSRPRPCGRAREPRTGAPRGCTRAPRLRVVAEAHETRLAASLAVLRALLDGERVGDHAVALRVAALRGMTAGARVAIVERLLEAARVLTGEHILPFNELDRLVEETEGAARATLLAALLDGRSNEELGDELDGVLLGARPRPRSVPDGLPGLAAMHAA